MKTKILLILCLAVSATAQTFDVISIHPSGLPAPIPLIHALPGGTMSAVNTTIQTLIRVAYQVGVPQIQGPDWIRTTHFDITAKGSPEDVSLAVMAPKIKAMLRDRFGLVAHEESVQTSALIVTGGEHIALSDGGDGILHLTRSTAVGHRISMAELCRGLSDSTGDLYVDQSGFSGRMDVDLKWSRMPDELAAMAPDAVPPINTVLKQKLGVTVKSGKVPLTHVVVDHVNREATEN